MGHRDQKRIVVVLGMHRSGTSVISRSLQVLGVDLGDKLMPPVSGINEKGFFEDEEITQFNEELLAAVGRRWDSCGLIDEVVFESAALDGFRRRAEELLGCRIKTRPFGLKDPRMCMLLPFWKPIFRQLDLAPSYVIAFRNPVSVAASLSVRDGFSAEKGHILWLDHVISSLRSTAREDRVLVNFDAMIANPKEQLRRMADTLALSFEERAWKVSDFAEGFLDDRLRHSRFKAEHLYIDTASTPYAGEAYGLLSRGAHDKLSPQTTAFNAAVERIYDHLVVFAPVFRHLENQETSLLNNNVMISGCKQTISERDKLVTNLQQSILQLEKQLSKWTGQVAILQKTVDEIFLSKSWRMTAPLRAIFTAVRRMMRLLRPQVPAIVQVAAPVPRTLSDIHIEPFYIDPKLDLEQPTELSTGFRIALHLHVADIGGIDVAASFLGNVPYTFDLFLSVSADAKGAADLAKKLKAALPVAREIYAEPSPKRWGDLTALVLQFGGRLRTYDVVGHFQASTSGSDLPALLGSEGRIAAIIDLLKNRAKMVLPIVDDLDTPFEQGGSYDAASEILASYTDLPDIDDRDLGGTDSFMFWARSECLERFLMLPLQRKDFAQQASAPSGPFFRSLRRLLFGLAALHPGAFLRLQRGDSIRDYRYYEEQHDFGGEIAQGDIKVLAYYLPQFHPIPENDRWHGKGFTEWTKVAAANPLFQGHYQQHIPHPELGYYLIDGPDILKRQADMMKKAGVHGQIFYHYWFSGKLLLENPVQILLDNPQIDMPYCFCWANENWTRRWDGNEKNVLLQQDYSKEDAARFIRYLMPFFKDPRYIRIENRPMLFIYRPSSMPDPKQYLDVWARECRNADVEPPYVVAVLTRGVADPGEFGMDAGVERVLHDWTGGAVPEINDQLRPYTEINGSVLRYDDVADFYARQQGRKPFTYFRSTVPAWDNTARYGGEAFLLHDSTPHRFQQWMESAIAYSRCTLPEDRRFVVVNAWNEWAEGAHLEPDSRYGYSYLNSVGRALAEVPYARERNMEAEIPETLTVHVTISEDLLALLQTTSDLKHKFMTCLARSSVFGACRVSVDRPEFLAALPGATAGRADEANFVLEFHQIVLFKADVIEKMLKTAVAQRGAAIAANTYDERGELAKVAENGGLFMADALRAGMLIVPISVRAQDCKTFRMRTDAHCFATGPAADPSKDLPEVTTIIRFHKSADLSLLENALYCLAAMQGVSVTPLITAQDVDGTQRAALNAMLETVSEVLGITPLVMDFKSPGGTGDLRSKMLHEGLRAVKSRYAAFLDYDDKLFPSAYSWLISRLKATGKAVSFGRVFATTSESVSGLLLERKRSFEYGYSYEDFLSANHAPIHSFILDLGQIDTSEVIVHGDQKYMEDYFLTLQLFTKDNADWNSLMENHYVGDYLHNIDREHTLALVNDAERQRLLQSPEYMRCDLIINEMQKRLRGRSSLQSDLVPVTV